MQVYCIGKLRKLGIEFRAPRAGDAGYDLFSTKNYLVKPRKRVLVESGLHLEIPNGYVGLVKDRSSVASAGLHVLAGVIDSAYRGELKILVVNLADEDIQIRAGQKIAQLLLIPVCSAPVEFVDSLEDLSNTERGSADSDRLANEARCDRFTPHCRKAEPAKSVHSRQQLIDPSRISRGKSRGIAPRLQHQCWFRPAFLKRGS